MLVQKSVIVVIIVLEHARVKIVQLVQVILEAVVVMEQPVVLGHLITVVHVITNKSN
jgi:hypothetical protein